MGWTCYAICRICLEENELMLNLFRTKLNEKLEDISSVIKVRGVQINDGLPMVICEPCANKLNNCYEFKMKCENSDSLLRLQKYAKEKDPLDTAALQSNTIKSVRTDSTKRVLNENKCKGSVSEEHKRTSLSAESIQVLEDSIKEEVISAELKITENLNLKTEIEQEEPEVSLEQQKCTSALYICDSCGKPLSSRSSLRRHQKLHAFSQTGEKNGIDFQNESGLSDDCIITRTENQNSENEPANVVEPTETLTAEAPITMIDIKRSVNNITHCPICNEAVEGLKGYRTHASLHKSDYPCVRCGKSFLHKMHFTRHTMGVLEVNQCKFCGREFGTHFELRFHLPVHGNNDQQACRMCDKIFQSQFHLDSHILNQHHLDDGIKLFMCEKCGKKFRTNYLLQSHLMIHEGIKPHACTYCGKTFANRSNMLVHTRIHRGEKPYACEFCGKTFTQSSELKVHSATHSDERPYECSICSKRFRTKNHYRSHVQIHGGTKEYTCDLCETAFRHRKTLKTHMLRHTGEKPYPCKVCGKCFTKSSNLKTHNLIHTGEKPHECKLCGETFRVAVSLRNHVSRYHKDNYKTTNSDQ